MSFFSSELSDVNAALQYEFGDPVTWISQQSNISPYALPGLSGDGSKGAIIDLTTERVPAGFYAVLRCVLLADLLTALNGGTDVSKLEGDRVQFVNPADGQLTVCRVANVSDPDYSGTVTVGLRKPSQ